MRGERVEDGELVGGQPGRPEHRQPGREVAEPAASRAAGRSRVRAAPPGSARRARSRSRRHSSACQTRSSSSGRPSPSGRRRPPTRSSARPLRAVRREQRRELRCATAVASRRIRRRPGGRGARSRPGWSRTAKRAGWLRSERSERLETTTPTHNPQMPPEGATPRLGRAPVDHVEQCPGQSPLGPRIVIGIDVGSRRDRIGHQRTRRRRTHVGADPVRAPAPPSKDDSDCAIHRSTPLDGTETRSETNGSVGTAVSTSVRRRTSTSDRSARCSISGTWSPSARCHPTLALPADIPGGRSPADPTSVQIRGPGGSIPQRQRARSSLHELRHEGHTVLAESARRRASSWTAASCRQRFKQTRRPNYHQLVSQDYGDPIGPAASHQVQRAHESTEGDLQLPKGRGVARGSRLQLHQARRRLAGCRLPRVPQGRRHHAQGAVEGPRHHREGLSR